tara:strand:+ start:41 stop:874 length:834 start_codon:yes stop_codon:yes gene_type:complete
MTLVAFEQSRGFDRDTDGQSGTRSFLVVEQDSTVTTQPSIDQVIRATGVRLYRQDGAIGDSPPPLGNLIPLSVNVRSESDAQIQYTVEFKYGLDSLIPDEESPDDPSFVSFTLSQRPVTVDVFRSDDGTLKIVDDGTDIAGEPIDQTGIPLTAIIRQQDLELSVRYESFDRVPNISSLYLVGKRNSTPFLGAAAGYLVYTGMSVSRDGVNSYRAAFTFSWDQWQHMRQVPGRDQNGTVTTKNDFAIDDRHHAENVFYKQPFADTENFNLLGIPDPTR